MWQSDVDIGEGSPLSLSEMLKGTYGSSKNASVLGAKMIRCVLLGGGQEYTQAL